MTTTLLWLDLETPGLEPYMGIVEVAWQLTTVDLEEISPLRTAVIAPSAQQLRWIDETPVVREMHFESGLLHDLMDSSATEHRHVVEARIVDDILTHAREDTIQLAGASVHFDKGFLNMWMPTLHEKLYHRVYDTSTLKTFFESLGVQHGIENEGQHRAANDVREVLAVARRYREYVETMKAYVHRSTVSFDPWGLS